MSRLLETLLNETRQQLILLAQKYTTTPVQKISIYVYANSKQEGYFVDYYGLTETGHPYTIDEKLSNNFQNEATLILKTLQNKLKGNNLKTPTVMEIKYHPATNTLTTETKYSEEEAQQANNELILNWMKIFTPETKKLTTH